MKSSELKKYLKLRETVTSDHYGYAQVCSEYKKLPIKNRIVLDLGGNIGAFAVYSALMQCKQCYSFEPDLENFKFLVENTKMYENIKCIRAAVTSNNDKDVCFFETTGKARDGFSIIPFKGRIPVKVPAVNFKNILQEYKPETIKMDIEGAEYELIEKVELPDFVTDIVMEIHFSKKNI